MQTSVSAHTVGKTSGRTLQAGISLLILTGCVLLLIHSEGVITAAMGALRVCYASLIPALLPAMILCELLFALGDASLLYRLPGIPFAKLFRLPGTGCLAFLCGLLFGFPTGAKIVCDLRESGSLSKAEAERLLQFANNTGPAFVVAGVGVGLRHSLREGVILLSAQLCAVMLYGVLLGRFVPRPSSESAVRKISPSGKGLGDIFRDSTFSVLGVCGCVLFFSVLLEILEWLLPFPYAAPILGALLEVGSACALLAGTPEAFALPLTAFAITFGGLSVAVQSAPYRKRIGLSPLRYLGSKLVQGMLAAGFCVLFCLLCGA